MQNPIKNQVRFPIFFSKQAGTTTLGIIVGVVLGLVVALGVSLYLAYSSAPIQIKPSA